ncbi:hypothetical protein VTJ49DRAFT_4886 [Mycothermus thermophilus]|uniref:Uncharacterized protein n=1 Tax=Humicola insolens TaxID=85995 RepID=A0ABR3V4T6_HUMIN
MDDGRAQSTATIMYPSFVDLSIIDLLEADPRPSFMVALSPHPPAVVYANPSLAADRALLDLITTKGDDSAPLWEWITGASASSTAAPAAPATPASAPQPGSDVTSTTTTTTTTTTPGCRTRSSSCSSLSFSNLYWTRSVVHEQMVVVGANEQPPISRQPRKVLLDAADPRPTNIITPPKRPASAHSATDSVQSLGRVASDPGWILPDIVSEHRPFLNDINSVDWAATPLGPLGNWPRKLDETFNQILVDSRPIALYWGPSYITVYNEAFSKLCGAKHPSMLGMPVQKAWPEAGQRLRKIMQGISPLHRGPVEDEWRFFVERDPDDDDNARPARLEETYLKWSLVPIVEDNEILGFMHPVAETTSVRLWERRMKMLIELGDVLLTARDVDSYWDLAIQKLATVEPSYDTPLAILYAVHDDPDPPPGNGPAKICRLRGTLGVPDGHPIAPKSIHLRTDTGLLPSSISAALEDQHPTLLRVSDGTLPAPLLEGLHWRGFGDPCHAAVICPIRPTKDENAMGFLLLGLNPRRPYGNDYRQYISLLCQKLATTLASVVLLEEEARRGRTAAAQAAFDQAMLQEKLAVQTKEATESMQMFEAVAEVVPVGMCFGDRHGNITYANDAWYKITGHPPGPGPIPINAFLSCVKDEDHDLVCAKYEELKKTRNLQFEFRVKRPSNPAAAGPQPKDWHDDLSPSYERARLDLVPPEDRMERHILATARAEYGPDGSLIRVLTCLTDVTTHKHTAEEAMRRAQQAQNLKRMAEFATVGMYDMDLDGRLLGANNVFFEMCGLPKVDPAVVDIRPWDMCVCKDDHALLYEKLDKMVKEDKVQIVEVRLKTTWTAEDGSGHTVVVPRSVQATMMPVRSSDGAIKSFTGCLSDVSLQKWQLNWEKERKEEAIESKRQQENFIDMTSHEMRNPLSAILHCADAITATLSRVQELLGDYGGGAIPAVGGGIAAIDDDWIAEVRELVESGIDNAETIVTCAQHQKRIVDDILTMSKLDSSLISITRDTVDPIKMVKEALKMFEVEARRVDINLSMVVDPCYHELDIKYLDFDPSRLKQVLINLLTNALKFTKTGPTRNVTVAVRASLTRPTEASSKVSFIPPSHPSSDQDYHHHHQQPVPANRANPVYLMFEVEDTGEGLTDDEKKSLFQRFVQASSRTHVKYGGSGLGLFISRRLTELQNGAIGVASKPGVGSTFAFYIEAYRPTEEALREAEALSRAVNEEDECSVLPGLRLSPNSLGRRGSGKRGSVSCGCSLHSGGSISSSSSSGSSSGSSAHISNDSSTNNNNNNNNGDSTAATSLNSDNGLANINGTTTATLPPTQTTSTSTPSTPITQLPPQSVVRRSATSSSGFSSSVAAATTGPPIRGVLVVEDNLINQQITRRGLLSMGFTVDVANHGVECLEKLRGTDRFVGMREKEEEGVNGELKGGSIENGKSGDKNNNNHNTKPTTPFPLSIILMDIEMPIQDGLTCTRAIRELERRGVISGGRIPIIAVSANARLEQIVEARDAGCDDVLVKPYRMPELLERMRGVMARVGASAASCST